MPKITSRSFLLFLMVFSSVWECVITLILFFKPEQQAEQYHMALTPESIYFGNVIGGFMILFSALCWWFSYQLWRRDPQAKVLGTIIGVFWVYMGVGLFIHQGAPPWVILDSVRGAVILILLHIDREPVLRGAISQG
jgi:hypothetical protein